MQSLNEFLAEHVSPEHSAILLAIASASRSVATIVGEVSLTNTVGTTGKKNSHGEEIQKLDRDSNTLFLNHLTTCNCIREVVSEEEDDPIVVNPDAKHVVAIDPLDGSSNIDVNITVGSIFGIYHGHDEDIINPSNDLAIAGYVMYGSSTIMVLALNKRVYIFTLDKRTERYVLTSSNVWVPDQGNIYSINEGNTNAWTHQKFKTWVDKCKAQQRHGRWVGSMIADCHRTLLKGGIFTYPEDTKNPSGKLRAMYEACPMALIFESAGGRAIVSNGQRILGVPITHCHQKSPVIIGGVDDVSELFWILNAP